MFGINEVPFKNDSNKKFEIEWQVAYPHVIFSYKENKKNKEVIFKENYDFKYVMEKLELKPEENDANNVKTLVDKIYECFKDNKVTIEIAQIKNYALEFKGENDLTLFKVFLKNDEV